MTFVAVSIVLVALAIFLLCFNIIFRKDGKFPDTEIGHNKRMREMGIMCSRVEEMALWSKKRHKPAKIVLDPAKIKYAPE